MTYRTLLTTLLFLCVLPFALGGPDTPKVFLVQNSVTPPSEKSAVEVEAGLYVEEIESIREGEGSFSIDGTLSLSWQDPRRAFDPKGGPSKKLYLEKNAQEMLDKIWWPDVKFANEIGASVPEHEELTISSTGVVNFREKVHVTLGTGFQMRRFPFDSQKLRIDLDSFSNSGDVMVFKVANRFVGLSPSLKLTGWTVTKIDEQVVDRREIHDRAPFSEIQVTIGVVRDPGFFVTKFLVPLCVVMIVLCGVLWIPAKHIKDRVGATLTGMLTAAAYGFTITQYLPPNVYDTFLDGVVQFSLVYCTGLMLEHIISSQIEANNPAKALKIDKACRWLFPLAFIIGIFLLAAIYLR